MHNNVHSNQQLFHKLLILYCEHYIKAHRNTTTSNDNYFLKHLALNLNVIYCFFSNINKNKTLIISRAENSKKTTTEKTEG